MLTAMRFLEWLTTRGLTLADATQADVDVWLDAGRAARRQLLADFVRWSNQHGLTNRIDVPTGRRTEPDLSMTSEERSAQLRRALSDEAVPVDVRAAAALLFLYGIPVSHIARIQLDDLVVHRGQAHLAVYGHRTVLPPAVDRLIRAAADAARPRSTVGQVVPGHEVAVRWRRGYADTSSRLPGRNAARLELAGEIPAAMLSVVLGISLSGATHWARRATRDWNAFVEARHSQRERPSRPAG